MKRRALVAAIASLALAAVLALAASASAKSHPPNRSHLKNFQHVWVVMMENTSYDTLIGNPNAPWINAAAARYGLATSYYGVTHPSQPNYVAVTSGSTNGVTSDDTTTIDVPNIVDQLEKHRKTWRDYQQSLSLCNGDKLAAQCGDSTYSGLYERKHDPFVSYADVQSSPRRMANVVDLSQLDSDLRHNRVADYNFIAPDQCHDMHGDTGTAGDPCEYDSQALIQTGDTFLRDLVHEITSSRSWTGNSVIFVTWDESDYPFGDTSGCCDANPGGGHVVTLVISHSDHRARTSDTPYNHYSLLGTIEDAWSLGCLANTCDTADVPRLTDLVGPKR
jgi:phosphatidylinositol-3-phosphatase